MKRSSGSLKDVDGEHVHIYDTLVCRAVGFFTFFFYYQNISLNTNH